MATLVRTGRYYAGGTPGVAHVAANNQWAYAADTTSGSGTIIWHTIGARVGTIAGVGSVTYQLAVMAVQPGEGSGGTKDVPAGVLARSSNHSVSETMDHGGAGVTVRHPLQTIITSPRNRRFAFAAASQHNSLAVGMVHAADIGSSHNTYMYSRSAPGGVVQAGPGSGSNQGHMAIWMEGDLNLPPRQPGPIVRSGGSDNRQPVMTAPFSDPNETLSNGAEYDNLASHRHELEWGGVVRWRAIYTSTATERANRYSQRQIGEAVPFNTEAIYRVWHRDRAGEESLAREITFTVASGGSVDTPTSPSGRVTDFVNPGNINFVYRNAGSLNGNRVRVGVFWENGAGPRSQREIARTVTRGTTQSITWASLWTDASPPGFPFREDGTTWLIGVQVRDTAGNWSDWSALQSITLNSRPNMPVLYGPADGGVAGHLYTTSVRVTDPDQPATALTVTARYYDANDNLIGTRTLPYLPASGGSIRNVFGATPSDIITSHGTYKWQAQASDGFLESAWSPLWTFTYAAVPNVTLTAPAGPTITTRQPTFAWTATGQQRWRLQGRNADGDLVYDTTEIANGDQFVTIGMEYSWIGGERWNNGETFYWSVGVQDSTGLWGWSEQRAITLEYVPPAPLKIVSAYAQSLPGAKGTHYAELVHSQPGYGPEDQPVAVWSRVAIDGPGGTEIPGTFEPEYARNTNMGSANLIDFDMTSGQWYRYGLRLEITQGIDVIESETTYTELMVKFNGVLMHVPADPLNVWVWLPYGTERYEPEAVWHQGHHSVMPTNGRAPLGYSDSMDYIVWYFESTLVPREGMTTEQQRDAFRRLWSYQNPRMAPNGRPNSVCFREGRGGDDGRVYGRITQPRRVHSYSRLYTVQFEFWELGELPVEGGAQ